MKLPQIAAQLYTLRDHCKTPADLAESLAKVRSIGYEAVQLSGICSLPEDELLRMLDGEGLVCCATHEPSDQIRREPEKVSARLASLKCRYTAYPFPAGVNFADPASVDALIGDLDNAGRVLAANDQVLGYHNHAIEFLRLNGKTILEKIFEDTHPGHLVGEIDTYWIQYGGGNPVSWCRKLAGRLPFIHLKDYGFSPENKPVFAEVGHGNLEWDHIIPAAEDSGCEWFIVEQDTCPGDPFVSLRMSFEFLREHFVK